MALPIESGNGPIREYNIGYLRLLDRLDSEDSSRRLFIKPSPSAFGNLPPASFSLVKFNAPGRWCTDLAIAPGALLFDGTTVAGSAAQLGHGEDLELIGTSEKLDAYRVLSMMRRRNDDEGDRDVDSGENADEIDEDNDERFDIAKLQDEAHRLSRKLYRSVEAYHLQSLTGPSECNRTV